MPFEYTVEAADRRVHVLGSGPVDVDAGLRLAEDIPRDPAYDPGFSVLADLRGIEIDFGPEDAQRAATALGTLSESYRGRVALLMAPGFLYRLASYTALHAEEQGFSMRVFTAPEVAEAWIQGPGD